MPAASAWTTDTTHQQLCDEVRDAIHDRLSLRWADGGCGYAQIVRGGDVERDADRRAEDGHRLITSASTALPLTYLREGVGPPLARARAVDDHDAARSRQYGQHMPNR